jgi:hypothetical protein
MGRGIVSRATKVVTVSDEVIADPIFIVGTNRSGTSLLRRILDSHPNIACPTEANFLVAYLKIAEQAGFYESVSGIGFDREEALKGLRCGAAYFHQAYMQAKAKSRWADKTPRTVWHLDTVAELFGSQARFIVIFRHPLDVAYSLWQRKWNIRPITRVLLEDVCSFVADSLNAQLAFVRSTASQCFVLYYDHLVDQPAVVLKELCAFLGEEWSDQMLKFYEFEHDFGLEDPMVRGIRGFSGSFGNWTQWGRDEYEYAVKHLNPVMNRLGFAINSAKAVSQLPTRYEL